MNETLRVMQNHRSIRSYQDKAVPEEMIEAVLTSVRQMPTSINGQQVSIIVVQDQAKKKTISEIAGGQPWIAQAPVFLVFVADFYKTSLGAQIAGNTQVIHESVEGTVVGIFDAGIAMGAAIIAAESLGLGIVPIGGIRANPEEMIKLLNLPQYTYPVAGLVMGYPADTSHQKPRLPMETFAHKETYQSDHLKQQIECYDEKMTAYYAERGDDKQTTWSKQVSGTYQYVYFPKVYPTMKSQGFNNDK